MMLEVRKTLGKQRGAAAVELAFMMIPLLILAFGVAEYGRAVYEYNTLAKSARNAARYLSQYAPGNAVAIGNARNLAVYGSPAGGDIPVLSGLGTTMVSVCDRLSCPANHSLQPTGSGLVNLVTVTISGYTFTPAITYVMPSAMTFDPISVTMVQVL